jgi:hypothetical protein
VVEPLTLAGEEPRDAGRVIRRLDELDLRLPDPEERDPDPVGGDVLDGLEGQSEEVPVEGHALVERPHDDGDMVDPARRRESGAGPDARLRLDRRHRSALLLRP